MEFDPNMKPEANAVSLYGDSAGIDDFPVLKAFQQYIDAEQAKARKRLVWICSIFGVLTILIVLAFAAIIATLSSKWDDRSLALNQRNQELNDRLVEYAMKERDRAATAANEKTAAATRDDASTRILADTLSTLQKQLAEQQKRMDERNASVKTDHREQSRLDVERAELDRQRQEDAEKLKRARALLAAERERLHQQEIELQRRKLYPEYYRAKDEAELDEVAPVRRTARTKPADTAPIYCEEPTDEKVSSRGYTDEDTIDDLSKTPSWVIPE